MCSVVTIMLNTCWRGAAAGGVSLRAYKRLKRAAFAREHRAQRFYLEQTLCKGVLSIYHGLIEFEGVKNNKTRKNRDKFYNIFLFNSQSNGARATPTSRRVTSLDTYNIYSSLTYIHIQTRTTHSYEGTS